MTIRISIEKILFLFFCDNSDQDTSIDDDSSDFEKFHQDLLNKDYNHLLEFTDLERQVDSVLRKMRIRKKTDSDRILVEQVNQEIIQRRSSKGSILSARCLI